MNWEDMSADERTSAAKEIESMVALNPGWQALSSWALYRIRQLQERLSSSNLSVLVTDEKARERAYQDQSEMLFLKTFLRKPQELILAGQAAEPAEEAQAESSHEEHYA